MRIHYLLFALLFLFLMLFPGNGGMVKAVQKYYYKVKNCRYDAPGCLTREEQIGHCSLG
ncbi:beta-defensin 103A-like [Diceros bicornis minor]|uniref:beta-defensin 103A-like n=1 Tax=Diceros bicornis minor TaxID=77932 RepID=UPI0026F30264|nr:beta-defensin 103A-like [Diceros bicornis minor]XP_058381365.1 beta-defensin 103A-like [Diceros bicornis minor]